MAEKIFFTQTILKPSRLQLGHDSDTAGKTSFLQAATKAGQSIVSFANFIHTIAIIKVADFGPVPATLQKLVYDNRK